MPQPSLDELALLLMQLDPADDVGARRFAEAMRESADTSAGLAPASIIAVLKCTDAVENCPAADREMVLVAAGTLLETWMRGDPLAWVTPSASAAAPAAAAAAPTSAEEAKPAPVEEEVEVPEALADDVDLDLLRDFINESRDMLVGAEAALLQLETDPTNDEAVNTVFRAFHTVKGTAAFLGLGRLSKFAHKAESLLSQVRDRALTYSAHTADLALQSADMLREFLDAVEIATDGSPLLLPEGTRELTAELEVAASGKQPEVVVSDAAPLPAARLGDILVDRGVVDRATVEAVHAEEPAVPLGQALVQHNAAPLKDVAQALRQQSQQQKQARQETTTAADSIRVRTDRLDRLIDMVGELVIAQAMIVADEELQQSGMQGLTRKVSMAGKIVRDLQDLSMSMRMVPLKPVFQKLARLVRDLSQRSGKAVEFQTHGEDTELDRNMVDAIADPLVHMVRNSLDHGLETPAERTASGKRSAGVLRLSAYHAGGAVVIELHDDGRGLNREKILAKAAAKGLIDPAKPMSDQDVFALIFAPGFSTADQVTDISGRGVGMDVVRRNIEGARGTIEISSTAGQGTTFRLRLPLTLAITDGMLVRVGNERYIVPTTSIQLSFRPSPEQICTVAGKGEMVVLRGETLPIVRLHRLFAVSGARERIDESLLMLVGDGDKRIALMVDDLLGQHQVVAKSLGQGIGRIDGLSGGAILGDGRVGLIIDVGQIVNLSRNGPSADDGPRGDRRAVA
ncbi:MAG: chemotaxis protein CheA [Gemmatimonadota bacterium]|nr:chemotaxis protein CheA [Gemmatimonadota bacterium]